MHEVGLAQELLEEVSAHAAAHPEATVRTVRVALGAASGYAAESLRQAYEVLVVGTRLHESELEVSEVEGEAVVLEQIVLEASDLD